MDVCCAVIIVDSRSEVYEEVTVRQLIGLFHYLYAGL